MEAPVHGKRVLEFYSGIGGMRQRLPFLILAGFHAALKEADKGVCVLEAFDINTFVNRIYEFNFRRAPLSKSRAYHCEDSGWVLTQMNRLVLPSKLRRKRLDYVSTLPTLFAKWLAYPLLLSLTNSVGNQKDDDDSRTKSLLVLLKLFADVKKPPTYLMLENVSGFQTSKTRDLVIAALQARDYAFQEVMLSPSDIGVPNSRLRYFLLAKRRPLTLKPYLAPTKVECFALNKILERDEDALDKERLKGFLVPEVTVTNQGVLFDVVKPADRRSCCFTKAYGRYVEGTGSVLQTNTSPREGDLHDLRLRYLTPREIASLHCFPADYGFPADVTVKQQWKALGNSLNVRVVAVLLRALFDDS